MNHADVKGHLADYLEGELELDARALVDAHLDACSECAREVEEMQQTIRLLRMLPDPETPPMLAARVMERIRSGESRPTLFQRIGDLFSSVFEPNFVLPASAVAAAALVVVALQGPASLSRLGLDIGADRGESAQSAPGLASPPPLGVAGLEAESGLVFGAPAAQDFRASVPARSGSSLPRWQGEVAGRTPGPRIRIELEPISPQGSVLFPESVFGSRMPGSIVGRPSADRPGTSLVADPWSVSPSSGLALPVAQPGAVRAEEFGPFLDHSGGGDARDEWLARGLREPVNFARYIASQSLAEQELWVARLAERAASSGLLDELVRGLRDSGDAVAAIVAEDFAAEAAQLRADADTRESSR